MKRIVIYVYNEEIEALKPMAEKLNKQGGQVRFLNLKYNEPTKCDVALAKPEHLDRVKAIFANNPKVEVKPIDTDLSKDIKEHNKNVGITPRQGEGSNGGEAIEQPKTTADNSEVVMTAGEPAAPEVAEAAPAAPVSVTPRKTKAPAKA